MKRLQLQELAESKLADAHLLLVNERYGNAYYLSGYAIELGLKACIAKQIVDQVLPSLEFMKEVHTHNVQNLVRLAGLTMDLASEQKNNVKFNAYWGIVGGWSEKSRYASTDVFTSQNMVLSVGDPVDGVMRWIRRHW
jgi:hypothetical protein